MTVEMLDKLVEANNIDQEEACKHLWVMVIIHALQEANEAIIRSQNKEQTIAKEMAYFYSRDFQIVCALADIYIDAPLIEERFRLLKRWGGCNVECHDSLCKESV
ncbi:MAG: hypothetical protein J6568_04920 [Snodgrassella sp.]|nr:hypothetical protein [Snodgrassella sp.]